MPALTPQEQALLQEVGRLRTENQALQTLHSYQAGEIAAARKLMEEARALEARLRKYIIGACETFEPAALTELRREQGREVDGQWGVDEWASWFMTQHLKTVRRLQAAAATSTAQEAERLREENRRLIQEKQQLERAHAVALRQAREAAHVGAPEAPPATAPAERKAARPAARSPARSETLEPAAPDPAPTPQPRLSPEEIERRFGRYWVNSPRELVDDLVRVLAQGDECRRKQLIQRLGRSWGGRAQELFVEIKGSLVEEHEARLTQGNPTLLLNLTARGRELALALGETPRRGLPELLSRHVSLPQALLALRARDVLSAWGYTVDLWPAPFHTASRRQCRPDLLATTEEGLLLYVELEVHPVPSEAAVYARNGERIGKWQIFHEVNAGRLYLVLPTPERQDRMIAEIAVWQQVTNQSVVVYTTNVSNPGHGWERQELP